MIKKYKWTLLVTSALILLPMVIGLCLWGQLPEQMAIHFNAAGEADGFAPKWVSVFAFPLFMLAMQWFCTLVTAADPKRKNVDGKPLTMVLWIVPLIALPTNLMLYGIALGMDLRVECIVPILIGVMFVVVGNYMPKCRRNYTIGIKIPWTLHDDDNWKRTHRLAGRLWMAGGIVLILTAFWGNIWIVLGVAFAVVLIPMIYSYWYYQKHR